MKNFNCKIEQRHHDMLKKIAKAHGKTQGQIVRDAIEAYCNPKKRDMLLLRSVLDEALTYYERANKTQI